MRSCSIVRMDEGHVFRHLSLFFGKREAAWSGSLFSLGELTHTIIFVIQSFHLKYTNLD